jgi:methylase of polypeptide subunit release factors
MHEHSHEQLYLKPPTEILDLLESADAPQRVRLNDIHFTVLPHVFPSQSFRTTKLILESIRAFVKDRVVTDMGCGFGAIGLAAMHFGASQAILVDINEHAVWNAIINRDEQGFTGEQVRVFHSDCFDSVPPHLADVIIFNPPFHSEPVTPSARPLERSLFDPSFQTMGKFLDQAVKYSHDATAILIAFSSKGDVRGLEALFTDHHCYSWSLWRRTNEDARYDNRIYLLGRTSAWPVSHRT